MHKNQNSDEIERCVAEWLARLPEKHGWVVRRRFGLDGQAEASIDDLAKELQVSAEHVRQIQMESLERLLAGLKKIGLVLAAMDDRHSGERNVKPSWPRGHS
jgi:DNA-directed RNA polymerase sigma subunit (sigma70/sigma32)